MILVYLCQKVILFEQWKKVKNVPTVKFWDFSGLTKKYHNKSDLFEKTDLAAHIEHKNLRNYFSVNLIYIFVNTTYLPLRQTCNRQFQSR